jgi:F-type H+-transporting ATPase subunit delta
MDITIISKRYAKALFSFAIEMDHMEQVYADMLLVADVIQQNRKLHFIFKSPVIPGARKIRIVRSLFEKHISRLSMRFLELVLKKDRALLIRFIADGYIELYKEFNNIISIVLITAAPIEDEIRKEILGQLGTITNKTIDLAEEVNTGLIGGFVLKFKDGKYDASIRTKLDLLSKEFEKNPYIKGF